MIRIPVIAGTLVLSLLAPAAARQVEPATPKTEQRKTRAPIYDESADASAQITEALAAAKRNNRRVLVQWGANWCGWCHLLHDTFEKDRAVRRKLLYEYDVVLVDVGRFDKHLDVAERYGALEGLREGIPFLTILDADGSPLVNHETGSLEAKIDGRNGHDAEKVVALLETHQAPYLTAESVRSTALAKARDEGKTVFLHFGAPWCGWCTRLEEWMRSDLVAPILAKDFVDLKIDTDRMIGGGDMLKSMTGGVQSGIPWFAFLGGDGKVVVDSFTADRKNVGCPAQPKELEHFRKMLGTVAVRATPEELDRIVGELAAQQREREEQRRRRAAAAGTDR